MTDKISIRMKTQGGQPIEHDFVQIVSVANGLLVGFTELGTVYCGKVRDATHTTGGARIEWIELENIDKS